MKYVITDRGEVATGERMHVSLAAGLQGRVVAAGHYRVVGGGCRVEVFGRSYGVSLAADPRDAAAVARHLGIAQPG